MAMWVDGEMWWSMWCVKRGVGRCRLSAHSVVVDEVGWIICCVCRILMNSWSRAAMPVIFGAVCGRV